MVFIAFSKSVGLDLLLRVLICWRASFLRWISRRHVSEVGVGFLGLFADSGSFLRGGVAFLFPKFCLFFVSFL